MNVTGEVATRRGYRRVSNKYLTVARIDRPDWILMLARQLRRAPADFYVPGEDRPTGNWCDFYRRVMSKDVIVLDPAEFRKVPTSCGDPTGYVPVMEAL